MLGYADDEGHPIELVGRGLLYWPWLVKEIVKSAIEVAAIIVNPSLPIAPRLLRVKPSQKTPVGVATYANSITLTPGTITVEVDRRENELLVHALTQSGADGLAGGEMDRRVTVMEGAPVMLAAAMLAVLAATALMVARALLGTDGLRPSGRRQLDRQRRHPDPGDLRLPRPTGRSSSTSA